MTPHSSWLYRLTLLSVFLGMLGVLATTPTQAKPMSSSDTMLQFFPNKPLGAFRATSLRAIIKDILVLVRRSGFERQVQMFQARGFREATKFLQLKKPIHSWAGLFQSVGLSSDPSIAFHLEGIPTRPHIGGSVVLSIQNAARFTQIITELVPRARDKSRFRKCKRYQRRLQRKLARLIALKSNKKYTIRDLTNLSKNFRCPMVSFKVVGKRVEAKSLANGLAGFRKRHGTHPQIKSLGKMGTLYKLDKLIYAMVDNRYVVWGSTPAILSQALKRFDKSPGKNFLVRGFRQHLSNQARYQVYLNYKKYMKIAMRLQRMFNNMVPRSNRGLQNNPQIKKLQKLAMSMGKGYDSMWMDGRVNGDRYSIHSVVTTAKKKSMLVEMFNKIAPAPLRSLALLPRSTIAVFSMNIVQFYFELASVFLKKAGNKALSQFVFSIGQWQKMFGDELTIAVGSSPTSPIQGMLLLEVKQPDQLSTLLTSMQAILGAGGKSPIKSEIYKKVYLSYLFRSRGGKRNRRSPTDKLPPGELAWGFVGNYFVLTFQMTRKPNLALIKRMLDPKLRRTTSLLTHPVISRLLRRTQRTNMLMYVAMPELLRAVRMFAPPLPQVQQVLRALSAFSHIFAHARNKLKQNKITAEAEIALIPAPTTHKSPHKK